jgi:hypothetical protein
MMWAFDPGTLTGVSVWDGADGLSPLSGQYTVEELYALVDEHCTDVATAQVELFTITEATVRKARVSDPMDVIGFLKYAGWRCGWTTAWTKPADVMRRFPDAALKKAGLFVRGRPHQNDATRHLAAALVKAGRIDPRRFLL